MTATMAESRLGRLPVVHLDELNTLAALQTRVDRKYLVRADELDELLRELPSGTRVLEVAGERAIGYSSTYFDTADLDCYFDAATRRRQRYKVRTRSYETGGDWLEVKTRAGRATIKQRTPIDGVEDLDELDGEELDFVAANLGVKADSAADLAPSLRTDYRRTTLLLAGEPARVTIDQDLRWQRLPDGRNLARPGLAIVETKTGSTPSSVDRTLWLLGHRPTSISKYATGLAALSPELPHNRWHRVLQRWFDSDGATGWTAN